MVDKVTETFEKTDDRQHATNVVRDRFKDDRRDLPAILLQRLFNSIYPIERQYQRLHRRLFEHPSRVKIILADLLGRADDVHAEIVMPAVITALKLDDLLTPGDEREPAGLR